MQKKARGRTYLIEEIFIKRKNSKVVRERFLVYFLVVFLSHPCSVVEVLSIYLCRFGVRDLLFLFLLSSLFIMNRSLQIWISISSFSLLCIITLSHVISTKVDLTNLLVNVIYQRRGRIGQLLNIVKLLSTMYNQDIIDIVMHIANIQGHSVGIHGHLTLHRPHFIDQNIIL